MNLMQKIAQKLGKFTQRKAGEEFLFACPKCHHSKLEINPCKKLFHCFRCGYKGLLDQILRDLNVQPFYTFAVQSINKPVVVEQQECKIPGYTKFGMGNHVPYAILGLLMERGVERTYAEQARWGVSTDHQFKGRLIIPIIEDKITVSYIARSVDKSEPKELSGPNRSWFLYNIDEVKADEPVVIVEGIFDAEAVKRAGFNAVAIMGSNISDTQVGKLLAKKPSPIFLMLDGDRAGAAGAQKMWRKLVKRAHTTVVLISLPDEKDPDEIPAEE